MSDFDLMYLVRKLGPRAFQQDTASQNLYKNDGVITVRFFFSYCVSKADISDLSSMNPIGNRNKFYIWETGLSYTFGKLEQVLHQQADEVIHLGNRNKFYAWVNLGKRTCYTNGKPEKVLHSHFILIDDLDSVYVVLK